MSVRQASSTISKTGYVYLPDEGVDVWRPVRARKIADNDFQLPTPRDYDPQIERWQFPPGSAVQCERKTIADGEILAAVRLYESKRKTA